MQFLWIPPFRPAYTTTFSMKDDFTHDFDFSE